MKNLEQLEGLLERGARILLLVGLVSGCTPVAGVEKEAPILPVVLPTPGSTRSAIRSGEFRLMSGVALIVENNQDGRRLTITNRGPRGLEVMDLDSGMDYLSPLESYIGCDSCPIKITEGMVVPDWAESFRITSTEKGKNRMVRVLVLWPWTKAK